MANIEIEKTKKTHFPLFISSSGKEVVVFGGGTIATRRVKTLIKFDFNITVISPTITKEIKLLVDEKQVAYIQSEYKQEHINNQYLVLACTNDEVINNVIGEMSKTKGILTSVCSDKDQCDFYFPAIIETEDVIIGIVGDGSDHKAVRRTADKIRRGLDED